MLTNSLRLPDSSVEFDTENHTSLTAYKYLIDLLNIDPQNCEPVMGFDHQSGSYFTKIMFHENYLLEFNFQGQTQGILLNKGEAIQIYRFYPYPSGKDIDVDSLLEELNQAQLQTKMCNIDMTNLRVLAICTK